jgi:uncharacterized protein YjiS (DUF1127 family)
MAFGYRLLVTFAPRRPAGLAGALVQFKVWIDRARQRRALRELALHELNDRRLRDIGVTRTEALRESGRPFWDS